MAAEVLAEMQAEAPRPDETEQLRARVASLLAHRRTWRRRAWRLQDALMMAHTTIQVTAPAAEVLAVIDDVLDCADPEQRRLTASERALSDAIGKTQGLLEDALELGDIDEIREHARRAWRELEDALIALQDVRETCPACGAWLDDAGVCPDAEGHHGAPVQSDASKGTR